MAELNGGQLAARQLAASGIDTIFGVVAGPMIEVMSGAVQSGIKVVNCRHEVSAGLMASGWGWAKGKPGVCVVGSGPALTNAVTPMHVASESAMPLVVLGGSTYGPTRGLGGFQEADQTALARPACKWTQQVDSTERIPEWVYLSLGKAASGRPGAVYLDFPGHYVSRKIDEKRARMRTAPARLAPPHPDPQAIEAVAGLLAGAERPLLLFGKGAAWSGAGAALGKLADLGIPYVCAPMARGTVPDDHPGFSNGARGEALAHADVVLMIGGRFNWIFGFGAPGRFAAGARVAQIDVAAEELWSGAGVEIGIVADARVAAEALVAALAGRKLRSTGGPWAKQLADKARANEGTLAPALDSDAVPIDPHRLCRELRDVLPRDASLAIDGETIMGIARQVLPGYVERALFNAGTTGCMGTGVPYAIGAKLARPEAPSVALLGDYAFGAAALEVETAARVGAPVVFVVANNEGIAGHSIQDGMFPPGAPRIASLLPAHYEKLAELVDGHAERVEQPHQIRPALERALASGRVSVVHVRCNPKATRLSGGVYLR
jgi:thiamine pyrophosphate-dependent acetolactate synthase large subunit-like protein